MAKSSGFVYRGAERSVEGITRRARQAASSWDSFISSDATQLKVKEGETTVRILPPTWEDLDKWGDSWEIHTWIHYGIGPDSATYLCLDKMLGKPCPCCDARRGSTDEDELKALRPTWRGLAWVIDRKDEKSGPQIWSFGGKIFKDIIARSVDKRTNTPILLDDPEEGYDLSFSREGTGKESTNYLGVEVSRDSSPIHENQKLQDRWIEYVLDNPLPEMLQFYEYDYMAKVLSGRSKPKDDDVAAEETTTRRRPTRTTVTDEAEEVSPRPASRRAAAEAEEEVPFDEATETRRSPSRRAVKGAEPEPEPETRPSRARNGGRAEPGESADRVVGDDRPTPRGGRRAATSEAPTDDPPERQARRGLERLRERTQR